MLGLALAPSTEAELVERLAAANYPGAEILGIGSQLSNEDWRWVTFTYRDRTFLVGDYGPQSPLYPDPIKRSDASIFVPIAPEKADALDRLRLIETKLLSTIETAGSGVDPRLDLLKQDLLRMHDRVLGYLHEEGRVARSAA